jgi:hypothetical protein
MMPSKTALTTPYAEVNLILDGLLAEVQQLLGDNFVGFYLDGSLAGGDFDPQQSDIDFVVVTAAPLADETVSALATMHQRLRDSGSKWGYELEGSYIPQQALRRYDPANAYHPNIERGKTELLCVKEHHSDWIIHRHILREYGITLAGPPPRTLIDPIQPDELRGATAELLRGWWAAQLSDTSYLQHEGYRTYAVLTMCRILYTLEHRTIVSKPAAARWAQATLPNRWSTLVQHALQPDKQPPTLSETLEFIRYTLDDATV